MVDRQRVRLHAGKGGTRSLTIKARAVAELAPGTGSLPSDHGTGYHGPLAYRRGKPMRPDVARVFDRMAARRPHLPGFLMAPEEHFAGPQIGSECLCWRDRTVAR